MSGQDQYKELLEKKYGEILFDEYLRSHFIHCLVNTIFRIGGLKFILEEDSLSIIFPPQFFGKLSLFHAGKPSKKKINDFFETWRTLANESEGDFSVDTIAKPSPTMLRMKTTFYFMKLEEKRGVQLGDIIVRDMLAYLKALWGNVRYELLWNYGYNIKKTTF